MSHRTCETSLYIRPEMRNVRRSIATEVRALGQARAERKLSRLARPAKRRDEVSIRWPRRYNHRLSRSFGNQVREGLRRIAPFEFADVRQPNHGVVFAFEAVIDGRSYRIGFDSTDSNAVRKDAGTEYDLYLKAQFNRDGYESPNVVPAGYPIPRVDTYLDIAGLRSLADKRDFQFDVYGRFGVAPNRRNSDIREKAIKLLAEAQFTCFSGRLGRVPYAEFMREIAQSQVCIDLPGHGFLCYRLVQYMAVGACVISPPNKNRLPVLLEDRVNIVYTKPDLSDLVELCRYYCANDEERDRIAANSRSYFDRHLHRDRLVEFYLDTIRDRFGK